MDPFETKKTLRDYLVALTKELIRFPSHASEPLKIFELVEFIETYFEKEKVCMKRHVFGGIPSLVITTTETKHPTILLAGHIDVVPSSIRYTAFEEEGWLYGSGAMDMKGGVAVMIALLKYFSRLSEIPSLGIMLTSDEEVGSQNGTIPLLEKELYRANFVIINEGRHAYDIVTKEKGILIIKLVSTGEYIHSAYPWKAKNSIHELMRCLVEIQKIFPQPHDAWMPTFSVTVFRGGEEYNTIPDRAEALINVRFIGGSKWSQVAILDKIKKRLSQNVIIEDSHSGDVFIADTHNRYFDLLRSCASHVLKKRIRFGQNHGSSDAKNFSRFGLPVAILGPVGKKHHSPHEAVDIESLVTHFEVLKRFISEDDRESRLKTQLLKQ